MTVDAEFSDESHRLTESLDHGSYEKIPAELNKVRGLRHIGNDDRFLCAWNKGAATSMALRGPAGRMNSFVSAAASGRPNTGAEMNC